MFRYVYTCFFCSLIALAPSDRSRLAADCSTYSFEAGKCVNATIQYNTSILENGESPMYVMELFVFNLYKLLLFVNI